MKKNILYLLTCISFFKISGQVKEKVPVITSPEATALYKRNQIPVNHSSGGINYSLDLYTIKLKGLDIPIKLNYNSSGFKVSENASIAGLGWNLEYGGKIVQIPKGPGVKDNPTKQTPFDSKALLSLGTSSVPDAKINSNHGVRYLGNDDYEKLFADNSFLFRDYTDTYEIIFNKNNCELLGVSKTASGRFESMLDYAPDEYIYSHPNGNGSFYFGKNGIAHTIPFKKVKIKNLDETSQLDAPTPFYSTQGMEITDENGNIFRYSAFERITNYSNSSGGFIPNYEGGSNNSATYYLTSITTPYGETVEYKYTPYKYRFENMKNNEFQKYVLISGGNFDSGYLDHYPLGLSTAINWPDNPNSFTGTITAVKDNYSTSSIDGITINEIWVNGVKEVSFNYSSDKRKDILPNPLTDIGRNLLNNVSIIKNGKEKRLNFDFDYFGKDASIDGDINQTADIYRLKLKSIQFDNDPAYKFNYLDTAAKYPSKTNPNYIDHWGYYNGNYQNIFEILGNSSPYPDFTAFRKPDLNYEQLTLLKDITYPTGGKDEFIYELNKATISGENEATIGGIRINSIITTDSNNRQLKKTYTYINSSNNRSSGILYEKPNYWNRNEVYARRNSYDQNAVFNNTLAGTINFVYDSVFDLSYNDLMGYNGMPVFYPEVQEYSHDEKNGESYKTNYTFTYFDDLKTLPLGSGVFTNATYDETKTSYAWKRGLPLTTSIYKSNSNDPIKNIINHYNFLDSNLSSTTLNPNEYHAISYEFLPVLPYISSKTQYPLCTDEYAQLDNLGRLFGAQPDMQSSLRIKYGWLISAPFYKDKETVEEFLDGNKIVTTTEYKYDNPANAQITSQKTINPDNSFIETTYKYAHEKGNQYLIDKNIVGTPLQATITKTENGITKTISDFVTDYPANQSEANTNTSGLAVPKSVKSIDLLNPIIFNTEMTYDLYDDKGNVRQYTEKDTKSTVIIWGYNKRLPILKIEGITYNTLIAITNMNSILNDIINKSDADIDNSTEQQLISALDILRGNPALSNCQISTYTYDPIVGVTTITPPSGIREIYKYNTSNRLESVVDINNNILKEFKYNIKTTAPVYYNVMKTQHISRNNCPAETTPGIYTYIVPANKYSSIISQVDVEQQAQNEININGQSTANANAVCTPIITYYNTVKSQLFTRNNCPAGTTAGTYTYTVPAGTYTSTISQADADQKALNDLNINGQNTANMNATCTGTGLFCTATGNNSSINILDSSFQETSSGHFNAYLYIDSTNLSTMDWNDGVTIGTVGNSCKPNTGISSNVIEGGGREWMVNIYSNGSINLRLLNGSVTTGDRISLNFDYSKN
ncbi:DUF5977 domain-containing protein [Elizabethkingia sp. HX XZB]|uniref:DUF5977 domain-containing protein n=1 Tax=Elizabethkingia TaxID=308865 RepID=UPI002A24B7FC|nr:DUF5977 domain-containing protein [Elizabethkingia sp. HX XZB]MDX8568639.1 DUF5977 domain-containing protein [Elizabethkingia sp. HX XZB]